MTLFKPRENPKATVKFGDRGIQAVVEVSTTKLLFNQKNWNDLLALNDATLHYIESWNNGVEVSGSREFCLLSFAMNLAYGVYTWGWEPQAGRDHHDLMAALQVIAEAFPDAPKLARTLKDLRASIAEKYRYEQPPHMPNRADCTVAQVEANFRQAGSPGFRQQPRHDNPCTPPAQDACIYGDVNDRCDPGTGTGLVRREQNTLRAKEGEGARAFIEAFGKHDPGNFGDLFGFGRHNQGK
jgi:hypothetical protein